MKTVIRTFFRLLRTALGPVMLLQEWATRPTGLVRPPDQQRAVEQQCQSLALYQFRTCPFCIKVRQEMRRLSLPIEQRDAQHDASHRQALQQGSGATQVPCLRIAHANGDTQWLKDSAAIVGYLRSRFG
ncbi:MAG: glutaredoxin [Polaromonas sp.]|nr:glutaredoxin [Polaromonas sp.]